MCDLTLHYKKYLKRLKKHGHLFRNENYRTHVRSCYF